jgi:hypothetical protein
MCSECLPDPEDTYWEEVRALLDRSTHRGFIVPDIDGPKKAGPPLVTLKQQLGAFCSPHVFEAADLNDNPLVR